jgi:hypothetical protein
MIDIIAALVFGVTFTIDVAVFVGLAPIRVNMKVKAFAIAGGWAGTLMTIAALGGFSPGAIGRFPAPVLAFSLLVIVGLIVWYFVQGFRNALLSLPLAALIAVNGFRIAGVFFLVLFAQHRLSAPFGPVAGWGDIITGISAIPIAAMAAYGKRFPGWILTLWNTFGALDLVVAMTLAALSAPGSAFQVFMDPRGTEVLTTVPWIAAATLLVPLYLFSHLTISARLRSRTIEQPLTRLSPRAAN